MEMSEGWGASPLRADKLTMKALQLAITLLALITDSAPVLAGKVGNNDVWVRVIANGVASTWSARNVLLSDSTQIFEPPAAST